MDKLTLTLSIDEINLILRGLGKLPAEESFQLIQKLHIEYNKSQREKAEKEAAMQKFEETTASGSNGNSKIIGIDAKKK